MLGKPKQQRSQDRINKILDAAELILEQGALSAVTIAKVSELAELKRTSTYKFFETPEDIKLALIHRYVALCSEGTYQRFGCQEQFRLLKLLKRLY